VKGLISHIEFIYGIMSIETKTKIIKKKTPPSIIVVKGILCPDPIKKSTKNESKIKNNTIKPLKILVHISDEVRHLLNSRIINTSEAIATKSIINATGTFQC